MMSKASSKRARDCANGTLCTWYSRGMPRANPEISRPFDMQSSIANSSANLSGSCRGKRLP